MTLGDILKSYRSENSLSMEEFAKKSGINKGYISMLENNINPRNRKPIAPTLPTIQKIADGMGVDIDILLKSLDGNQKISLDRTGENGPHIPNNIFPIEIKKFPLLGEIACGHPIFVNEDRESYILAGSNIKADFCLKARGDSMINARILDGDIVFIRQQPVVNDGEIAAVVIDDTATLKRVYYDREQNTIQLVAENPAYRPLIYQNDMLNEIQILGKAVAFQSDVR